MTRAVWILEEIDHDHYRIVGVYATRKLALEAKKRELAGALEDRPAEEALAESIGLKGFRWSPHVYRVERREVEK